MRSLALPIVALALPAAALAAQARIFTGSALLNEEARLTETVSVWPLYLSEDSRCPPGVDCIQAGRLVLQVRFQDEDSSRLYNLVLGAPLDVEGGKLTLTKVTPEDAGDLVAPRDHRFDFTFEPNEK